MSLLSTDVLVMIEQYDDKGGEAVVGREQVAIEVRQLWH